MISHSEWRSSSLSENFFVRGLAGFIIFSPALTDLLSDQLCKERSHKEIFAAFSEDLPGWSDFSADLGMGNTNFFEKIFSLKKSFFGISREKAPVKPGKKRERKRSFDCISTYIMQM